MASTVCVRLPVRKMVVLMFVKTGKPTMAQIAKLNGDPRCFHDFQKCTPTGIQAAANAAETTIRAISFGSI